jgi:hypothetical protein
MAIIMSVETVLLVLLVVLVAGLLRSHAELLRRLGPETDAASAHRPPSVAPRREDGAPAPAVAGTTPDGDALRLDFDGGRGAPTLLAFLSTGCSSCAAFCETLDESRLPAGVQAVIVTRGRERERLAGVRALAPEGVPVVMSSQAWEEYRVPGSPYFVLVEESIRGEGVATTWSALTSLVSDAIEDERAVAEPQPRWRSNTSSTGRARDIDATLAAGGITPGHPTLYPAGRAPESS